MSMMRKKIKVKAPKKEKDDDPFSARFRDAGLDVTEDIAMHRQKTKMYVNKNR
jgi:hypothetical protein